MVLTDRLGLGADPDGDRLELQLSEFAWDERSSRATLEPASGIEGEGGGARNQDQGAAVGSPWCVPWPLVAQPVDSLVFEERLAESLTLEYGRRIREGEQERDREWCGSLLLGASPGRYISWIYSPVKAVGAGERCRTGTRDMPMMGVVLGRGGKGGLTTTTGQRARQQEGKRKEKGLWCRDNDKAGGDMKSLCRTQAPYLAVVLCTVGTGVVASRPAALALVLVLLPPPFTLAGPGARPQATGKAWLHRRGHF
ncbi:hypothetical protein QBC39DRAFT_4074 [Podospora conica]|nr:hypothetical protein QBC39DRAFT_4074 [Schizothecium conicum]